MKNNVTVVREDNLICVEGYCLNISISELLAFTILADLPENWRAIQFHGQKGDIEFIENGQMQNKIFYAQDYEKYLQIFVTAWEEEKYRIENPPEPSLEELKGIKHKEINAKRDLFEISGFEYLGSVFDTDEKSYLRIIGADNLAMKSVQANQEFSIEWTLADNSKKIMNAEEMLGLLPAFALYSDGLHKKANLLKVAVENASTKEELASIIWE